MPDLTKKRNAPVDYHHRTTVNLIGVIVVMLLGALLLWVGGIFSDQRQMQRCLDSGRHDCIALSNTGR